MFKPDLYSNEVFDTIIEIGETLSLAGFDAFMFSLFEIEKK